VDAGVIYDESAVLRETTKMGTLCVYLNWIIMNL